MTKLWVSTSNVLVDWTPLPSYFISQICDCLGRLRIYIKIQTVVQRTGQSILVYRLRIYLLTCVLQYKYLSHETCFPGSLYHLDSPCFTFVDYCVNKINNSMLAKIMQQQWPLSLQIRRLHSREMQSRTQSQNALDTLLTSLMNTEAELS